MLANGQVKSSVLRQILARELFVGRTIGEARTVIDVCGGVGIPGKGCVETNVERVALIVVERTVAWSRLATWVCRRKTDQSASNGTPSLRDLIRVCEVKLAAMPDARGSESQFPSSNQCAIDRDRDENVRFADIVVIKKVIRPRLEIVDVERPPAERNRHAELVLLIAFAVQRNERQLVTVLDGLKQRSGQRIERRSLVVVTVKCAESPIDTGNFHGNPKSGIDRVLHDLTHHRVSKCCAGKMGGANSRNQGEP